MTKRLKLSTDIPKFEKLVLDKEVEILYSKIIGVKDYLGKELPKYSNRLFPYIGDKGIDVVGDPFPIYNKKPWSVLSAKHIKRKKHDRFWFYKGKLRAYLKQENRDLTQFFGEPLVSISSFKAQLGGKLKIRFKVSPYPKGIEGFSSGIKTSDAPIYNRLFGEHVRGEGYVSNDEARPLIEPAMRAFVQRSLSRRVNSLMREGLKMASNQDLFLNAKSSIIRYITDMIQEIKDKPEEFDLVGLDLSFINIDAHANLAEFGKQHYIGLRSYSMAMDEKFAETAWEYAVATWEDKEMMLHDKIMNFIIKKSLVTKSFPLLDDEGKKYGILTFKGTTEIPPVHKATTRAIQYILVEALLDETIRIDETY